MDISVIPFTPRPFIKSANKKKRIVQWMNEWMKGQRKVRKQRDPLSVSYSISGFGHPTVASTVPKGSGCRCPVVPEPELLYNGSRDSLGPGCCSKRSGFLRCVDRLSHHMIVDGSPPKGHGRSGFDPAWWRLASATGNAPDTNVSVEP